MQATESLPIYLSLLAAAATAIAGEPTDVMSQIDARVDSLETALISAQVQNISLLSEDELAEHALAQRLKILGHLDQQETAAKTRERLAQLERERAQIERLLPEFIEEALRNAKLSLKVEDSIDFSEAFWRREVIDTRPGIQKQRTGDDGGGIGLDKTMSVLNVKTTSFVKIPKDNWNAFPGPGYKPIVTCRLLATLHPDKLTSYGRTWSAAQKAGDGNADVEVTIRDSEGNKRTVIHLQPNRGYAIESWQEYSRSGSKLGSYEFSEFVQRAGHWVPSRMVEHRTDADGRPLRKIVRRNEVIEINAEIPAERFVPPAEPDIYGQPD